MQEKLIGNLKKMFVCLALGMFAVTSKAMADYHYRFNVECKYDGIFSDIVKFDCTDIHGTRYYLTFSGGFFSDVFVEYVIPELIAITVEERENMNRDIEKAGDQFNHAIEKQREVLEHSLIVILDKWKNEKFRHEAQDIIVEVLKAKLSDWENSMDEMKKRIIHLENELNVQGQTENAHAKKILTNVFPPFKEGR